MITRSSAHFHAGDRRFCFRVWFFFFCLNFQRVLKFILFSPFGGCFPLRTEFGSWYGIC